MLRTIAEAAGIDDREVRVGLIAGGRSNLTYRVEAGDRRWVLRRPPLGHVLATAHDMAREFQVLDALGTAEVRVPATVLFQPATGDDPAYYVMHYVDGRTIRTASDAAELTAADARAVADDLVDQLVALHAVAAGRAGLAGFGRPEGFLNRQLRRWRQQWDASVTPVDTAPLPVLADELAAAVPDRSASSVVHGDYRLDNTLVHRGRPGRVAAIIDWEMSTLGDPLTDLGLLLAYWSPAGARVAGNAAPPSLHPGFPDAAAIAERYLRSADGPAPDLGFYLALACFKLAAIAQTIVARHRLGLTVDLEVDTTGVVVAELVDAGRYVLGGPGRWL